MNARLIHGMLLYAFLSCSPALLHADERRQTIPIHSNRVLEDKLIDRMKKAQIPHLKLKDVQVKTAFAYLKDQMKRVDPGGRGFNILYKCRKESQLQAISIDIRNAPVSELFYFICMKGNLNYRVEKYAIVVWDIKKGEKMNKY